MLSRYYKLKEVIDLLRVFCNQIGKSTLQDATIKSIIKNNTLAIAAQLNNEQEPDYGEIFIITEVTGWIQELDEIIEITMDPAIIASSVKQPTYTDISNLKIDRIIKLMADTQEIHRASDKDFENILKHEEFNKYIYYNYYGSKLYFKRGSSSQGLTSLSLYYYRLPKVDITEADYIDLKDVHIPMLIDRCKNELKELVTGKVLVPANAMKAE